jgi:hypothetical protein
MRSGAAEVFDMPPDIRADDIADFDLAVLGGALPPEVESLISRAGLMRAQVAAAQALLDEAHARAPRHPATLIALYRFHFYGNRLAQARDVSFRALACASAALGLPEDWREVAPDARFEALEAVPRFYLFSLKGMAYLSLRLGELDLGRGALAKLAQLDPKNRVGHQVLHDVLARMGRDDLGYEDCPDISPDIARRSGVAA